jgi:Ser/Thr protein kinase RdoA (MazF antagonist)
VASRLATLVVCVGVGDVVGALPPFEAPSPWWRDATELVAGARERFGLDVVVLRLLSATAEQIIDGGPVSYLVQADRDAVAAVRPGLITPVAEDPTAYHPLRMSWARPGGPQADLAWVHAELARGGFTLTGRPEQVRTWNLSSIWTLPTDAGRLWLKVVPPFFAHEGDVISAVARTDDTAVPELVAHDGPRLLMRDITGGDRYEAVGDELTDMVRRLVDLQAAWLGRTDDLLSLGVPDWRPRAYEDDAAALVDRGLVGREEQGALDRLLAGLPDRLAAIDSCGVPDTLLHGDFHPGNVRGDETTQRLLDWGDSGVGHPLLDETAFTERLSAADAAMARAAFDAGWRATVPGCDPNRAAELLAPVAALRAAVVYQRFLDAIEPAEHAYHRTDPQLWLQRAAELAS